MSQNLFRATKRKPASDGPQYKAFGNSMAVPVVRWITDRIRVSWEGENA